MAPMPPSPLPPFDDATAHTLQAHGFDAGTFERLRSRLKEQGLASWSNAIAGTVEVPGPRDVAELPGTKERGALEGLGREALGAGGVGVVLLAGGMATRFGGVVKAGVEVLPGRTFLDLKLADVAVRARAQGVRIPVYVMTSFATHADVSRMAAEARGRGLPVETFSQAVSVRLTPDGEVFREADGRPSLYAPGHGDLTFALRSSGILARFREAGGRLLVVSNVDNLAASLDPIIVGAHLLSNRGLTVEVVSKLAGDRGGAPARVNGSLQIVESFRFPAGFDQDAIPVFNTNTLILDAAAVDRDFDLTWFAVQKSIGGRPAVQFERLVGELTAFVPSHFLRVERAGAESRFQPVKDPEELAQRLPEIRQVLEARGIV
jgi:UTP--glucose-1-phosphate uridylyltransferase